MGKFYLSSLISDGMVIQREAENVIWGYAEDGRKVSLSMGTYQTEVTAGERGFFQVRLPGMQAGGPWEIRLCDGETTKIIRNVLVGDVFLLGGQSNMELPIARVMERFGEEIKKTINTEIRMFEVPKEYCFGGLREEITKGRWLLAAGEELQLFSAAGYFAAAKLYESEKVPIGLLQTAVGGTPVKAWCCEETIKRLGYDVSDLAECRKKGYPAQVEREEQKRSEAWWDEARKGDSGEKGRISLPEFFSETTLRDFCGAVNLRKKFFLEEQVNWEEEDAVLYLGALTDADFTCINGEKIGETAYRYPPRIYPIPKGVLHAGENEVLVEMLVFDGEGCFMPGKEYVLRCGEKKISLSGEWDYEIKSRMPRLPETTFFQYKAAGLYQGMLYPIRRWNVRGCFFYQGESNTGRPESYEEEFTAMIADWRRLFDKPELPFLFVQLAGFSDGKANSEGRNWAKLREAQRRTAEHVENARLVPAYDLGEYNDLHPIDKKSVGERIALAAENLIYGKLPLWWRLRSWGR